MKFGSNVLFFLLVTILSLPGVTICSELMTDAVIGELMQPITLDLAEMTIQEAAQLLEILDNGTDFQPSDLQEYIKTQTDLHRRTLGRALVAQLLHLVNGEDSNLIKSIINQRDNIFLNSRTSPLHQYVVIPVELSKPSKSQDELAYWKNGESEEIRMYFAKATGLNKDLIVPGLQLSSKLRAVMIGRLARRQNYLIKTLSKPFVKLLMRFVVLEARPD